MYSQLMKEKLNADDMKINQLTSLTKKRFIGNTVTRKGVTLLESFVPKLIPVIIVLRNL
jgi:hypothetical protein